MAVSRYQNFETETIPRHMIKAADYNPRIMDEAARKRLGKSIRTSGLVSAITWNKRTGNLVAGHQRLAQLDALEKGADYDLTVCVIDVDEREEARLNVLLNNQDLAGDWDLDKLAGMAEDFDLSLDDMGFSQLSGEILFDGDERFTELSNTPEADSVKGKLRDIKEERGRMEQRQDEESRIDYYLVIVFADGKEREEFQKKIHVPLSEQYITADQVYRLCGA